MIHVLNRFKRAVADRYTIEREIGRGGMAIVFLAQDVKYGRAVAVKLLRPELTACLGSERFLREIEIAAKLSHPNIVPVFDSGQAADLLYYVMPFVAGESLRSRLHRNPAVTLDEALRIMRDVGMALSYAHTQDVIHRDIKPENILLSSGPAVVADFGIARAITEAGGADITTSGFPLGTLGYMSPEQAAGSRSLDRRTDVYSLGCVLYEMLCGNPPGRWLTREEVAAGRIDCQSPAERDHLDAQPPEIESILIRALAQDPGERFQSAEGFLEAVGIPSAVLTPTPRTASRPRPKRGFMRGVLLGAAAIVLLVSVVFVVRSRAGSPPDPNTIAVAPFDVLGRGLDSWREGLVDLLSASLDGAGPLSTVAPSVTVKRWEGRADAPTAARFGQDVGAGLVLFGRLVAAGADTVRASISLYDVVARRTIVQLELRSPTDRIDLLADSAAVHLMQELSRQRTLGAWRLASLGSNSPVALRAFLQGEQHWRRFDLDSARGYFEMAIAADSGFALAYSRLANALGWDLQTAPEMIPSLLRAGALNHGLARRESLLLVADSIMGAVVGLPADSVRWRLVRRHVATLEFAAREYPLDPQVWYELGEARFHRGPYVGVLPEQAAEAFERAVELDSSFVPAYRHLIELNLIRGDPDAARRVTAEYLERADSTLYWDAIRVTRALLERPLPDSTTATELLLGLDRDALYQVWYDFKRWPDSAETALQVAQAWAESSDSVVGRITLALGLAYRGHFRAAEERAAGQLSLLFAQVARLGTLPRDSVTRTLDRWLTEGDLVGIFLGLPLWLDRADTAALARAEAFWETPGAQRVVGGADHWLLVTRAYRRLAAADTLAALAILEQLPIGPPCRTCYHPLLTRARVLAALGRLDEATAEYDRLEFPLDQLPLPEFVLASLERGRLHERLGNHARAVEEYAFVADVWRHADDELQPVVEEAREALTRLAAEPRR